MIISGVPFDRVRRSLRKSPIAMKKVGAAGLEAVVNAIVRQAAPLAPGKDAVYQREFNTDQLGLIVIANGAGNGIAVRDVAPALDGKIGVGDEVNIVWRQFSKGVMGSI